MKIYKNCQQSEIINSNEMNVSLQKKQEDTTHSMKSIIYFYTCFGLRLQTWYCFPLHWFLLPLCLCWWMRIRRVICLNLKSLYLLCILWCFGTYSWKTIYFTIVYQPITPLEIKIGTKLLCAPKDLPSSF